MAVRNIKVGDRVIITDNPTRPTWRPVWVPSLNQHKGKSTKVIGINSSGTIRLEIDNGKYNWATRWLYRDKPDTIRVTKPKKHAPPLAIVPIGKHIILGQNKAKKHIEVAVKRNMAVLLVGDTGTGKTTIVKDIADKRGQKFLRFNLTGETTVEEFVGKYILEAGATKWQDGVLLYAMKQGLWLIVDEVNVALPEILFVLHSLLDDDRSVLVSHHESEIVTPHSSFRFFGTMNPVDEYAGTKDLNKAFKSRFGMILELNYPTPKTEAKIVSGKGGIELPLAGMLVDVAVAIRKAKARDEVFYTCSTRDLIQLAQLIEPLGLNDALTIGILNKANGDKTAIRKIIKEVFDSYASFESELGTTNLEILQAQAIDSRTAIEQLAKQETMMKESILAELSKQTLTPTTLKKTKVVTT